MTVCTSQQFLDGVGAGTLAGLLAAECGARAWVSWKDFINNKWECVEDPNAVCRSISADPA